MLSSVMSPHLVYTAMPHSDASVPSLSAGNRSVLLRIDHRLHNIPSLRSDTPLPQRISAGIPRREHSSDSRRRKPPSSTVVHNNNACRSAGAEIYPGSSCFPRRCTACMEQSTTISSKCFLPRSIQTPAEYISIRPQF